MKRLHRKKKKGKPPFLNICLLLFQICTINLKETSILHTQTYTHTHTHTHTRSGPRKVLDRALSLVATWLLCVQSVLSLRPCGSPSSWAERSLLCWEPPWSRYTDPWQGANTDTEFTTTPTHTQTHTQTQTHTHTLRAALTAYLSAQDDCLGKSSVA